MTREAYGLKPWNQVVPPHEDILSGKLEMSTYAADLGAVERDDPNVPRVYRDASEFFRTTYMTRNLRSLLTDVLRAVGGGGGDRVIQLRTPFGGGKTHALLGLYHLMKSRDEIDPSDIEGIPRLGSGRVAVLSGLDLDPWTPRVTEDGNKIQTLWGELAFRLGGEVSYERVRVHDENGSAPSGNVLRDVIGTGPVLILLDEVLVYVERAGGRRGDDPLRRQVMIFLQGLTEVVRHLPNAAMVYSLQASVHEAAGDEALLSELDHLVTRIDAKREPVSDDEVMRVVQRRLFPSYGDSPSHENAAAAVAREYALAYKRLREGYAESDSERRSAGQEAERLETRILESYPLHPLLLDLMYHRWGSLPSYQRTRGALQFLARVIHAIWNGALDPQPLIGPGDVPLEDEHVRGAFFAQVGERERYSSVLAADITGHEARCRDVDRRVAADSPVLERLKVGTRCAAAVMLFSFGAREGEDKGVLEGELVQSLVSPALDRNVITTALHDLREQLLYLHYTGRRYRFEPKANLNLLISEEMKKFETEEVLQHVKDEISRALASARDAAVLWPPDSGAIPDGQLTFRVVYLGPEWTGIDRSELVAGVERLIEERKSGRREFRNALAFAVPGKPVLDRCRASARLTLALGSLIKEAKSQRVKIEKEQVGELEDRHRGSTTDLQGSISRLYEEVLVPVSDPGAARAFALESIDLRAQLVAARDLHSRMIDGLRKHVFDSLTPGRLVTLTRLGEDRDFISCEELATWFFSILDFPKLLDASVLTRCIGTGTADTFGYVSAARLEGDTIVPSRPQLVRFGTPTPSGEVDLGPGCFVLSPRVASSFQHEPTPEQEPTKEAIEETNQTQKQTPSTSVDTHGYRLRIKANAAQLFRVLPALQNLSDKADSFEARLELEAEAEEGFDPAWLRNAVEEHLDEAGVERLD